MEKKLKESERSYKTLAENLPGIVYRIFSREKNIIKFFNNVSKKMTGYNEEELSSGEFCSIRQFIHQEDKPAVDHQIELAIANNKSFAVEYRFLHKEGSIRQFLENGTPILGYDGKLLYIDGVIMDITKQK